MFIKTTELLFLKIKKQKKKVERLICRLGRRVNKSEKKKFFYFFLLSWRFVTNQQLTIKNNNQKKNCIRWMSWLPVRWRTQRNAKCNVKRKIQRIIKFLNANGAPRTRFGSINGGVLAKKFKKNASSLTIESGRWAKQRRWYVCRALLASNAEFFSFGWTTNNNSTTVVVCRLTREESTFHFICDDRYMSIDFRMQGIGT